MAPVLIVGAGPTGLAAALFLAADGRPVRIIDKAAEPTTYSKALAVNPRTLELLELTGVTARVLDEGRPIHRFRLMKGGHEVLSMTLDEVEAKFPMTALSQARTEALLTQALAAYGIAPERGVELTGLSQAEDAVTATLVHPGAREETVEAPLLFAADGAHSRVRQLLDIDFPGSALPEPWKLVDVIFEKPLDMPEGHVDLLPHGFMFWLAFDPSHWRIISTVGDPLEALPPGARVKELIWASEFHISHRIAAKLSVGRVALGGDAAHLHSPVGARGMNLGIEDAYVFAHIAKDVLDGKPERLEDYGRLRHKADKGVVQRVEAVTRMARGEGVWHVVREIAPHLAGTLPLVRHMIEQTVTGLDHPVQLS
jgi:2-polyprenyl-6-methoxyphenol hydroxylase-like FAD-dependent oxidoreductase